MRARAWLWSLTLVGMTAFTAWHLVRGQAIQTDLLDMLPDTEKNPVAELAIKSLAKTTGERAMFLVRAENAQSKAAALSMAEDLRKSGAFKDVTATLPPMDPGLVGRFYAPYAWRVAPPPGDLIASKESLKARIESRLVSPQGSFSSLTTGTDPLGTLDDFLNGLPLMSSRLT